MLAANTTIIENARIYTMDRGLPRAEAIAFREGRIVAVGGRAEVSSIPGEARRIDAGGRAIIPGLIDAHIHFLSYSRSLSKLDLNGVSSKQDALAIVAQKALELGPGRWIVGGGWNNNLWSPSHFPTRHDLDRVAPNNPVYLDRKDRHSGWANTLALQRAGITPEMPDPPGAVIGRDEQGLPNGMLYESAVALVGNVADRDEAPEDPIAAMRAGLQKLASMGLVGFHDCEGPEAFRALQELDKKGELPMRVVILLAYNRLGEAIRLGLKTGFGSERLRIGPVKIFSDGSLGSMTAQMLEPYEGYPGNKGIGTISQGELEQAITWAAQAGIPSAVHAIGDAANRRVLDAFRKAREVEQPGATPLIHRIEHAQLLHPSDIARFAQLGVAASMQPIHATSDMRIADRLWGSRARYSYAWRSLLDAGALVAFGSDAPVETPNPFVGLHAALTRQNANDQPEDGWYPQERLTIEEAVRAYTESAAHVAPYLPSVTGVLSPGSVADLLLLDRDIFAIQPSEIKAARPLATVVGGEPIYDPENIFKEGLW